MITNRPTILATAACLACAACTGCVLRKESITVSRDGSTTLAVEISGSVEELADMIALPSADSGWDVVRTYGMEDGKEQLELKSTRRFAPGEALPRTFAAESDTDADLYLGFPTQVRVEERDDGTYFFFHRTYTPRPWAYVRHWQEVFLEDDDIKKLSDRPVEELNKEERRSVIRAFAGAEAFRQLELARAALAESNPDLPVEHRLFARQALLGVYRDYDLLSDDDSPTGFGEALLAPVDPNARAVSDELDRAIERCDAMDEEPRGACYEVEAARLLDEGYTALRRSLGNDAGLDPLELVDFDRAYERAQRRYDVSDRLGGQFFEIEVTLPGTLVGHNGNKVDVDPRGGTTEIMWRFDGKAFRDRTHELIAVSRLTPDHKRRTKRANDDSNR